MRDLRSELDSVPGIGPRRRKALLVVVRQPGRRSPRLARRTDARSSARKPPTRCWDTSPAKGAEPVILSSRCPDLNFPLVIALLVLIFSLTVHEAAHAWSASRLGDDTARRLGRVSLNPVVHTDPIGTLLLPLDRDGVGRAVDRLGEADARQPAQSAASAARSAFS